MKRLNTIDWKNYNPNNPINIRISSRAIIIKNGQIALVKCEKFGYYKFPGGGVDEHESLTDALKRETKEETGLEIIDDTIKQCCYVKEIQNDDFVKNHIFQHESYYYFASVNDKVASLKLDDYEKELGFHLEYTTIDNALKVNQKLYRKLAFSFLRRELMVLNLIKEMNCDLKLIKPSADYYQQIKSYQKSFLDLNEPMEGTSSLYKYNDINEWLEWIKQVNNPQTCPNYLVPSTVYLCVKNGKKVVGMIDIRHYLNDNLNTFGGNIGYSIKPTERNKGYGTRQLGLAIEKCYELRKEGIFKGTEILITCNENNIGSKKVILANHGIYQDTINYQKNNIERYIINLGETDG